jgi:GNAT superfamily N-acetyltransferase
VLSYHIRPATAQDVGFLADVVIEATRAQGRSRMASMNGDGARASVSGRWSKSGARSPDSTTSVVELDNERVGRLRIARTADYIELCGIQLLPGIQCHGIGTAIIECLKAQAAVAGIPLGLGVEKDNPDARRLYERLGFVQVGETEQECKLRWNPQPDSDLPGQT